MTYFTEQEKEAALALARLGLSTRYIQRKTGISMTCIKRWSKTAGVPLPNKGGVQGMTVHTLTARATNLRGNASGTSRAGAEPRVT